MRCNLPRMIPLFLFALFLPRGFVAADRLDERGLKAKAPVPLQVKAFPLEDVRLLPSPFQHARDRDAAYLLMLEPDRLLSRFRSTAGLEPKAEAYGGWERMTISGHSLGHYLSACSLMYASTGDPRLQETVNYIVGELAICQEANGNGYVGGMPNGKQVFDEVARGEIRSQGFDLNGCWVPWYTLHKLFAGLIDAYRYCNNDAALDVACQLADWADDVTAGLTPELWQKMLACEFGGMNESLADLYFLTGKQRYLDLARNFDHRAILDPLAEGVDHLSGKHANTQIPKIVGCARLYQLTADPRQRAIATFFWDTVVDHHTYVTGGNSNHEYFGEPGRLNDRLSTDTTETCNTYNMLKLSRNLFALTADPKYIDYYERALYNHILGSIHPESGMTTYFVPLQSAEYKRYSNPFNSFTCCHGTGMENHAKYGGSIYYHNDDDLYVALFVPSVLDWKAKGATVRQDTAYPERGESRLAFSCEQPIELTLHIRRPAWASEAFTLAINGQAIDVDTTPGEFASITRTWSDGDVVEVRMPMTLRLETMPDNANRVAIFHGPRLLAGDLGPVEQRPANAELPAAFARDLLDSLVPVLVSDSRDPRDWAELIHGEPSRFRVTKALRPEGSIVLKPFHETHDRRYIVYWDLFTPERWREREIAFRAEQERLEKLAAATIDVLRIGEMQPERDHNLTGQRTSHGDFNGRKWRHATDGGWFSFDMKVSPDEPNDLLCTYWGDDGGNREFEILVNGTVIATQKLERNSPGEFFDVRYPIPVSLTNGQDHVTIRLQALPGKLAGGLFGCRTMRHEPAVTREPTTP